MKINHKIKIGAATIAALGFTACGGGADDIENLKLEELVSKRDSLKTIISDLNTQIEAMDTAASERLLLVSADSVRIQNFSHKIEVQGAVETDKNALLNAEASGVVRTIHVKEGQKVTSGQALITLDASIMASQIDEIQTQLDLANYMYEKQKKLMEEGVGTEIEFEQAKAQKNALESSLKTMRNQQGKTVVRAPFSGTIDDVIVSLGEMAAPGVPLLRIVDNKEVQITASISENLLGKVSEGTNVELYFPSLNDTTIITQVSSRGNFIDPVNRTFRIRIDLKKNTLFLPNQLAKLKVTDFTKQDATVIPSESIFQDTQNKTYVYKLLDKGNESSVKKVYVEVLSRYQGSACVAENQELTETDRVVVNGAKGITEADIVTIQ